MTTPQNMTTEELLKAATARPLETSTNAKNEWDLCASGGGDMVADFRGNPKAEFDAELLCRAVNSFEAMREALVRAEIAIRLAQPLGSSEGNAALEFISTALALADGKQP